MAMVQLPIWPHPRFCFHIPGINLPTRKCHKNQPKKKRKSKLNAKSLRGITDGHGGGAYGHRCSHDDDHYQAHNPHHGYHSHHNRGHHRDYQTLFASGHHCQDDADHCQAPYYQGGGGDGGGGGGGGHGGHGGRACGRGDDRGDGRGGGHDDACDHGEGPSDLGMPLAHCFENSSSESVFTEREWAGSDR